MKETNTEKQNNTLSNSTQNKTRFLKKLNKLKKEKESLNLQLKKEAGEPETIKQYEKIEAEDCIDLEIMDN